VVKKNYILWATTPCSLLKADWRFGRTYPLLFHVETWAFSKQIYSSGYPFRAGFWLDLLCNYEVEGEMFLRNVGWHSTDHTALYLTRQNSSWLQLWELHTLLRYFCSRKYMKLNTSIRMRKKELGKWGSRQTDGRRMTVRHNSLDQGSATCGSRATGSLDVKLRLFSSIRKYYFYLRIYIFVRASVLLHEYN
jgi:hypothetical protein